MSSNGAHDALKQSIEGNLHRYEAIALSMAISFELEDFMKAKGISKKELAEAAGVSPSYFSQVFSGNKLFNLKMLAGIAQKYKICFKMDIHETGKNIDVENQLHKLGTKTYKQTKVFELSTYTLLPKTNPGDLRAVGGNSGC